MKRPKRILTDLDGVCLNWVETFDRYMVNRGYTVVADHRDHDKLGDRFDISSGEVFKHVDTFNSGCWEFGTIRPIEGATKAIKHLHNLGYIFTGITSCSSSPQTVALRKANIYNIFGSVFDEIYCVDSSKLKKVYLNNYHPCFWIEDKISNCLDGLDYGHLCILMDQPWNSNHIDDRYERCYSWEEVTEVILKNS